MKNKSITLFICFALWLPSQAHALIIMIPDKPGRSFDITQYYSAGMCRAKYKEAGKMFVWQNFINQNSNSVPLAKGETICIIGTGNPGTVGTVTNSAGYNIAGVLSDRISNPENAKDILLYACFSAVPDKWQPSLIHGMSGRFAAWAGGPWKGKKIYGANGACFSNQAGKEPYFLSVMKNPRPEDGLCSEGKDPYEALALKFKVQAAFSACLTSSGSFSGAADCIYKDADINKASLAYDAYMTTNKCTVSNGTTSITVP